MKHLIVLCVLLIIMTFIVYRSDYNLGLPFKFMYAFILGLLVLAFVEMRKKEHFEYVISNEDKSRI